jgi:hypothetical protein
MSKKVKTLNVNDAVAKDLDNYGYSYQALKPTQIPIGENILVMHHSFPDPYVARFISINDDVILTT